jgi:hypothetical protein
MRRVTSGVGGDPRDGAAALALGGVAGRSILSLKAL